MVHGLWIVVLLLVACCPKDVEPSLVTLNATIDGKIIVLKDLVPRFKHYGKQDVKARGELVVFSRELCQEVDPDFEDLRQRYAGKILLVDSERIDVNTCFGDNPFYLNREFVISWCKLNATIVQIVSVASGLLMYDHEDYYFRRVLELYPDGANCHMLETSRTDKTNFLLDKYIPDYIDANNGELPWGIAQTDENHCENVFSNSILHFWFRGILGGGFVYISLISCRIFWLVFRRPEKSSSWIPHIVLTINALIALLLGLVMIIGMWRMSDGLPSSVNNVFTNAFSGTSAATDYLIAVEERRVTELYNSTNGKSKPSIKRVKALKLSFATLLVLFDVIVSFLFLIYRYDQPILWWFIFTGVPALFLLAQLFVILYLTYHVRGMINLIRTMQRRIKGSALNEQKMIRFINQEAIVRHFRFWLIISVGSASLSMLGLFSFIFSIPFLSCESWAIVWSVIFVGKAGNVLSQSKIFQPISIIKISPS